VTATTRLGPDLYRIDTTVSGTEMPLALYLWEGDEWLVTDTGCVGMMRDLAIPAARQLRERSPIGRAVVTHAHADHFGGNAELLEANPACRIYVHRDDAAWAADPALHVKEAYDALTPDYPCPEETKRWVAGLLGAPTPVTRLEAGDALELGDGRRLRVVHLPGHSPGHIGLWETEERILILSDAILGRGQRVRDEVVAIPAYLDVNAYLSSIRTVRALAPRLACPAHFAVMDAAATEAFCDESEALVLALDHAVRSELADGLEHTLPQLTARVVPTVAAGVQPSMVAGLSVKAHLDALEWHGLVGRHRRRWEIRWHVA
jgi:glyoxylase-like metal-dependent hydrolase (beta-lactamase superfamily II)